ncbi:MAG: hypothetical protein GQ470_06155, partial [Gammaproteobacteria bacterium]|nr:hypothetical protein [Gammaproteobacteria bacterium]
MRFSLSALKIPDHLIRYGYYAACMSTLELYQLLTLRPVTVISLLLPIGYLLALVFISKLIWSRCKWNDLRPESLAKQQRQHFLIEMSLYAATAVISIIVSYWFIDIALTDLLSSSIIILTFGYMAGVDTTLAASRDWFRRGIEQNPDTFRLFPTALTLRRATISVLILILVFTLASALKLYMGLSQSETDFQPAVIAFVIDQLFYLTMLGVLMVWVIRGYSHNLHHILSSQLKVVRDAQAGEFGEKIPLLTQNELGLMGMQLNRLVDYAHERENVANLLKRVVSPDIMEKLVNTDTKILKQGEEREVAILFCDLRGFTEMSEGIPAEELIMFLNTFFSELSEIVSRYNGIINKFMGDAILAVYSTEHPTWAIDNAMATALDIAHRVHQFPLPDGSPSSAGIGIHFGKVVAG